MSVINLSNGRKYKNAKELKAETGLSLSRAHSIFQENWIVSCKTGKGGREFLINPEKLENSPEKLESFNQFVVNCLNLRDRLLGHLNEEPADDSTSRSSLGAWGEDDSPVEKKPVSSSIDTTPPPEGSVVSRGKTFSAEELEVMAYNRNTSVESIVAELKTADKFPEEYSPYF